MGARVSPSDKPTILRLLPQQGDDARAFHQIALGETSGVLRKAPGPFEAHLLDRARGAALQPCEGQQAFADAKPCAGRPSTLAQGVGEYALLLRVQWLRSRRYLIRRRGRTGARRGGRPSPPAVR